jgi:hypothetical protein
MCVKGIEFEFVVISVSKKVKAHIGFNVVSTLRLSRIRPRRNKMSNRI